MTGQLDNILAQYYSSTVIGKTGSVGLKEELLDAMQENPQVRKDAESKLAQLERLDDNRCYISKIQKKFLREVLNGTA
jgi:hypothetical protein